MPEGKNKKIKINKLTCIHSLLHVIYICKRVPLAHSTTLPIWNLCFHSSIVNTASLFFRARGIVKTC